MHVCVWERCLLCWKCYGMHDGDDDHVDDDEKNQKKEETERERENSIAFSCGFKKGWMDAAVVVLMMMMVQSRNASQK